MPIQIDELQKQRSDNLVKWLKAHPLIVISGLCDSIGYDRRNFANILNGDRYLPAKYIDRAAKILKPYGYTENK